MARGRGKYTPNDIEIMKRISININMKNNIKSL